MLQTTRQNLFSRIQNLHISQTLVKCVGSITCLVEFKIYISLKQKEHTNVTFACLVEFKIYISLKRTGKVNVLCNV